MAEHDEPSLELPSLFGRKKKHAEPEPEPVAPVAEETPVVAETPVVDEPVADEPVVDAPVVNDPVVDEPVVDEPAKPAKASRFSLPRSEPKEESDEQDEPDEDREFKLPPLPGRTAAIITGAVVGIVGALLTWASLQACSSFKGTESCGGEGSFLLIFVLLLMILAGGVLLAAWDIADPNSTSTLGVGIVCVVILLLLMEELLDAWMFVVVPLISAGAYAAAHWVTASFADDPNAEQPGPEAHDIR